MIILRSILKKKQELISKLELKKVYYKSTFLNIITQKEKADSGKINIGSFSRTVIFNNYKKMEIRWHKKSSL